MRDLGPIRVGVLGGISATDSHGTRSSPLINWTVIKQISWLPGDKASQVVAHAARISIRAGSSVAEGVAKTLAEIKGLLGVGLSFLSGCLCEPPLLLVWLSV
mmetsp:Transcript_11804/g.20100  ORF Transcript_11804/g.20100 Transcript_11804/m.20100 type:complete len:102 (+) Transcript_11804:1383-1688(+)